MNNCQPAPPTHNPKRLQVQGRKNTQIFLTPDITLVTFLQGFHEEIYKEDYTKPINNA